MAVLQHSTVRPDNPTSLEQHHHQWRQTGKVANDKLESLDYLNSSCDKNVPRLICRQDNPVSRQDENAGDAEAPLAPDGGRQGAGEEAAGNGRDANHAHWKETSQL